MKNNSYYQIFFRISLNILCDFQIFYAEYTKLQVSFLRILRVKKIFLRSLDCAIVESFARIASHDKLYGREKTRYLSVLLIAVMFRNVRKLNTPSTVVLVPKSTSVPKAPCKTNFMSVRRLPRNAS